MPTLSEAGLAGPSPQRSAPWTSRLDSIALTLRVARVFLLKLQEEVPTTQGSQWTSLCLKELTQAISIVSELSGSRWVDSGALQTPSTSNTPTPAQHSNMDLFGSVGGLDSAQGVVANDL